MNNLFLAALIAALSAACRPRMPHSDLHVTNPIAAKNLYPEVVLIIGKSVSGKETACTGTFIAPRLILTAAHCLFDSAGAPLLELRYHAPNDTVHVAAMYPEPSFKMTDSVKKNMKIDLAILEFKDDIAPAFAKISKDIVNPGMAVTVVGFGRPESGAIESLTKNYGRNEVHALDTNLSIVRGLPKVPPHGTRPGKMSATEDGDSGGAMFNARGELVGVISGTDVTERESGLAYSYIVNIRHRNSVDSISRIVTNVCNKKSMNR